MLNNVEEKGFRVKQNAKVVNYMGSRSGKIRDHTFMSTTQKEDGGS